MRILSAFIILLVVVTLQSCTNKHANIITYDLQRSDYLETVQTTGTIEAVKNIKLNAPRSEVWFATVVYLLPEGTYVKKGDTVCILEAHDLTYRLEWSKIDKEKRIAEMQIKEADGKMKIAMLEAQLKTNSAKMAITMLDSAEMKFATPVKKRLIELEMEKSEIEEMKLNKKLAAQKKINKADMAGIKSLIGIYQTRIEKLTREINSLTLTAPCDGILMHVILPTVHTGDGWSLGGKVVEGSLVVSNLALVQIPEMNLMQITSEVAEADFKKIENNQKVMIDVDAPSDIHTTGKVINKRLAGSNNRDNSGVKNYEVLINVDSCHADMIPGLSARCKIIIEQVSDTVVVPAVAIFPKDSVKIVYVEKKGYFNPVIVETGPSDNSKSVVTKGLIGNETVALMEPSHKYIKSKVDDQDSVSLLGWIKNGLIKSEKNE